MTFNDNLIKIGKDWVPPIIFSIIIVLLLYSISIIFGFYEPSCIGFFALNTIRIYGITLPNILTWVSYAFFHCSSMHLEGNSLGILFFGPFFFRYYGIKTGIVYSLLIIFFTACFETIFYKLYLFFLYLQGLGLVTLGSVINEYPVGAGVSSLVVGMVVLIIPKIYLVSNEFRISDNKRKRDLWISIMLVAGVFALFDILIALGDLCSFSVGIYANYYNQNHTSLATLISGQVKDFLLIFYNIDGYGNSFLAHIFGMLCGLLIFIKLRRNKPTKLLDSYPSNISSN